MPNAEGLAAALTREHREIDSGIAQFLAGAEVAEVRDEPLRNAMSALRRHIYLEETFLFPPLRAAGQMMPIMVMLREHGVLWAAMDDIDAALSAAAQGSADHPALLDQCRALLALLDRHNSKEEPVIYSRVDFDLADFLHAGRTPDGWVCETAGR